MTNAELKAQSFNHYIQAHEAYKRGDVANAFKHHREMMWMVQELGINSTAFGQALVAMAEQN